MIRLYDNVHNKMVFEEGGIIRPNYITVDSILQFELCNDIGQRINLSTSDIFRLKMYLLYVVKDDKV